MLQVFSIPESSATSTSTYSTNAGACPECKTVIDGPLNGTYGLKWENNFLCPDGCVYENDVTAQLFCFEQNGLYYVHSCPKENTTTTITSTTTTTTTTIPAKSCADPKLIIPSMITCTASSKYNHNHPCRRAFDGQSPCHVTGLQPDWYTQANGQSVGQWIQASFTQAITITEVKIMSPFVDRAFKDIELVFDGDLRIEKELTVKGCNSWDIISLDKPVVTKTMKIKINSVYKNSHVHGIREIAIYGCLN